MKFTIKSMIVMNAWNNRGISMKRTCLNTELSEANVNQVVTLLGWVSKRRNFGSILFIDLRDRSGIIQIMVPDADKVPDVRNEYVIQVTGI